MRSNPDFCGDVISVQCAMDRPQDIETSEDYKLKESVSEMPYSMYRGQDQKLKKKAIKD
jgi:hypothetical protein